MDPEAKKPVAQSVTPEQTAGNKPKGKMSLLKKIIIGVVVAIVVIIGLAFFFTNDAKQFANKVIDDIQGGNCTEVYDVTSAGFREETSSEDWLSICQVIGPVLQGSPENLGVSVSSETGQGNTGEASYKIKGTDDLDYVVTLLLMKEDGNWKLHSLSSDTEE